MALRTQLFQQLPWIGGVNTALDESQIKPGQLTVADNVIFDTRGSRKKRPGIDFNFDSNVFEKTTADFTGTTPAVLGGDHLLIFNALDLVGYYIWFDVDNGSADPAPGGKTSIEVDIAAADTIGQMIVKAGTAVDAAGATLDFSTSNDRESSIILTVADVAASLGGKFFDIEDKDGTVRVHYDVDDGSTPPAIPGGGRLLEVDINANDSASIVATKSKTALDADAEFTTVKLGNKITVTDTVPGVRTDVSAGDSGFAVSISTEGSNLLTITNKASGATTDSADATTGMAVITTVQGIKGTALVIGLHDFFFGVVKTHRIVEVNDDKQIFSVKSDGIRSIDLFGGTAWSSDIDKVSFETINNLVVITVDGFANVMKKWDGTESTGEAKDLLGTPPVASICREHIGRLWCNDKTDPDRLHYSTTGNPEEWNGTGDSGAIDIGIGDGDPGGITAIFPTFRGQLFVAKRTKIYRISSPQGTIPSPENFTVELVTSGIGCVSHNSVVTIDEGDVVFVSEKGIHSLAVTEQFGDFTEKFLSADIQKTFNDDWTTVRFDRIWGAYLPEINSIAFAVTDEDVASGANKAIWLYNIPLTSWYRWREIPAESMITVTDTDRKRLYFGGVNGRIARGFNDKTFDEGSDGTDTAITFKIITGLIAPDGALYNIKGFKKCTLFYKPVGTHTITTNLKIDNFASQSKSYSFNSSTDLLGLDFILGQSILGFDVVAAPFTFAVDGYGRAFKFTVEQSGIQEEVEIQGFAIEYEPASTSQETRSTD